MGIRIHKVYTRTGDEGETGLVGGGRVPKDSPRVEAYGAIDELNSWIGIALNHLSTEPVGENAPFRDSPLTEVRDRLLWVQHRIYDVGSQVATPSDLQRPDTPATSPADVVMLEETMDAWGRELPELRSFLLPGGQGAVGWLHVCRTVCRRAEIRVLELHRNEPLSPNTLSFINRLSDFLFVAARHVARLTGEEETLWEPGRSS